ncbi:MAG: HAMP domain-containing protein [Thermoplasmata archaeon]|nr:HAMP domain-containing protein [Thermoplasmata archaeon]
MSKITSWLGKITPKLVSLLMISVIIIGALFWDSFNDAADEHLLHESEMSINRLGVLYNTVIEEESEKLSVAIDLITSKRGLTENFINGERENYVEHVQATFDDLKNEHNITHFSIHNLNETCFVRLHEPDYYGDLISRDTLRHARDTMKIGISLELGNTAFSLRAVKPYLNGTQHIGYVELGVTIDMLITETGNLMGENVILTIQKDFINQVKWEQLKNLTGERNNWNDMDSNLIIDSTLDQPEAHIGMCFSDDDLILSNDNTIINLKYVYDNVSYSSGRVPIYNVSGQVIGSLILIGDITEHQITHMDEFQQTMLQTAIMLIIVIIFVSLFIHIWVSRPISEIIDKTKRFGKGEMDIQIDTKMKGEVGELAHAFDEMASELKEHKEGLEDTIAQRTRELNVKINELERYKKLTVDRELKMVELKNDIKELKATGTGGKHP